MKFQEMNEEQQEAIKQVILIALNVRSQEEQKYTHEFYRLLVLGNGMGIVLLATFMGAVVHNNGQVSMLRTPLIMFFYRCHSRSFGLNCAGRIVVNALLLSSSIMFGVGVYKCISVLGRLS